MHASNEQGYEVTLFQVDRTQFPIGQGGFHATSVETSRGDRLSIVIDCGGSDAAHRSLLIEAFAEGTRQHDILAISHLDEDHINGIDGLRAAGVSFNTVFLPHVDVEHYLKWMTLKLCAGESDIAELVRVVQTGGRLYGGDFGSVVRVGPPGLAPSGERDRDLPQDNNLAGMLSDDAYTAVRLARGPRGQVFSCSQSLTFKYIDWLFRFYSREWVCPGEVQAIWRLPCFSGLNSVVSRTISNMSSADWDKFSIDLEAQLSAIIPATEATSVKSFLEASLGKDEHRLGSVRKLVTDLRAKANGISCKALLGRMYELSEELRDYNDASMCIYSGPAQRGFARRHQFTRAVYPRRRSMRGRDMDKVQTREVGWISTGDADFSSPEKLQAFAQHYHAETGLTSVLVLPHHGSRKSFDDNMDRLRELIVTLSDSPLFIAPANPEHKKFRHPHWPVESTCRKAGDFLVVDRDLSSAYAESISSVQALSRVILFE